MRETWILQMANPQNDKDVEARASLRSRLKRWDLAIIPEIEKKLQAKKTRFFVCFPFFKRIFFQVYQVVQLIRDGPQNGLSQNSWPYNLKLK